MDLFDDLTIAEGRRDALFAMTSECIIKRTTGNSFDPDLGHEVATFDEVYTGVCGYKVEATQPTDLLLAGANYTITNVLVKLPIDAGVKAGDLLEITKSRFVLPKVGTTSELVELADGSHRTAERWRAVSL